MAHKKAAGSTANGRDSNPKMRGTLKSSQVLELVWVVISQSTLQFQE
jgi:ribosomal protein L27